MGTFCGRDDDADQRKSEDKGGGGGSKDVHTFYWPDTFVPAGGPSWAGVTGVACAQPHGAASDISNRNRAILIRQSSENG